MLRIELLGPPTVSRDGEPVAPRGAKPWALLAYLVLNDLPQPRSRLAGLLFPDASDPGATLRWNLTELRRTLGEGVELSGDPVSLVLPSGASVDVLDLRRGGWATAVDLPTLGRELLEGISILDAAAFTLWLDAERRHTHKLMSALLTDGARALLARGDGARALELSRRLVDLDPYDTGAHALMVRVTADVDGRPAAETALHDALAFLSRELGSPPPPELATVLDRSLGSPLSPSGVTTVVAQLEAGRAAVAAGAGATGIESLSRAVIGARASGDDGLLATALLEVGSAMVHAARGTDDDGAAALHEAAALALEHDQPEIAATAHRELGYIELLLSHYDRSFWWLDQAEPLAAGDDGELAWIAAVRSYALLDTGDHDGAQAAAAAALGRAESAGDERAAAFALAGAGRGGLIGGDLDGARAALTEAIARARAVGWASFIPWPETFRGEVELAAGDIGSAEELFGHAYALSCQIGDPCWESLAVRGLGLTAAARGEPGDALDLLETAPRVCRRLPDSYQWIEAYALGALATTAEATAHPSAEMFATASVQFSGARGLRDLHVQGLRLQAKLGVDGAAELAEAMAEPEERRTTAPATAAP